MRATLIAFTVTATLSACGTPPVAEQPCTSFFFAGRCVRTTLSQSQWVQAMHANPPHAECRDAPVLPGFDGILQCEAGQARLDQLSGMPAGIPAPSVVVVTPRGW